jgi:hypothetical protein
MAYIVGMDFALPSITGTPFAWYQQQARLLLGRQNRHGLCLRFSRSARLLLSN